MNFSQVLLWLRAVAASLMYKGQCSLSSPVANNSTPPGRGFELLFTDNLAEFQDVHITFECPLESWIKGKWVRNGLGQFGMGHRNFSHIFDAFGKLTSFDIISPNKLYFSHKLLKTESYLMSQKMNDIAPYVFVSDTIPPLNYFQKISGLLRGSDNVDVNVVKYGKGDGQYVALSDIWKSYQFDINNLKAVRVLDPPFQGQSFLSKWIPDPSAAHPLRISGSDDYINYVAEVSPVSWIPSKMSLVRIKSAYQRDVITTWEVKRISYIHSFGLTKHFAIIPEHPMFVNTKRMLRHATLLKTLTWEPKRATKLRVINIMTGEIKTFTLRSSAFFMHHINSFEKGKTKIVSDFVVYSDFTFIASFLRDTLIDRQRRNMLDPNCFIVRIIIDLKTQKVRMKKMNNFENLGIVNRLDMPIINEKYRFKRYSYVYGLVFKSDEKELSNITLAKKSMRSEKENKVWFEYNHYPMEPWFIPDPEGQNEDDGVLLCLVLDGHSKKSYIAVIDARTMITVNRAYLPTWIPMTIHGRLFE